MEGLDLGGFDLSALEELLGGGPSLEDFVSASAADLPAFDPQERRAAQVDNTVDFQVYVDAAATAVGSGSACNNRFEVLMDARQRILDFVAAETRPAEAAGGPAGQLAGHLWHCQAFHLELPSPGDQIGDISGEPCLRGSVAFGDCVDHEWLVR